MMHYMTYLIPFQNFPLLIIGPETWDSLELYWDLYLVTLLFGVLGLMIIMRRPNSQVII